MKFNERIGGHVIGSGGQSVPVWIARDGDGSLYMYFQEPYKGRITVPNWQGGVYVNLDGTVLDDVFSWLCYEDGFVNCDIGYCVK